MDKYSEALKDAQEKLELAEKKAADVSATQSQSCKHNYRYIQTHPHTHTHTEINSEYICVESICVGSDIRTLDRPRQRADQ